MLEQHAATSAVNGVSDYEEQIWMLQLQQPEQITQQFSLWKLNPAIDLAILIRVIQNIVETTANLNVRYKFSDDGDLYKYPAKDWSACLHFQKIDEATVLDQLAQLKAQPWDAEIHPPFATYLFETNHGYFLTLVLHPILDQTYQQADFVHAIEHGYQQYAKHNIPLMLETLTIPDDSAEKSTVDQIQNEKMQLAQLILTEFRTTLAEPEMTLEDDFFDFGGHSLLATRIIGNLLNRHGIEIGFNDFFKSPSAKGLAEYALVKTTKVAHSPLSSVTKAPLTIAQDFLWQAYSAFDFSPIYNLPFAVEFLEPIDEEIFRQAFSDIVERHASLRSIFQLHEGQPYQQTVPIAELKQHKWFWTSAESKNISLASEAGYQFDLSRELPIRIRLLRNDQGRQILSFLVHHMVIDEWSLNTIMSDLTHAYQARSQANAPRWDAPAQTIHDFSLLQQKQGINQEHIKYWTQLLQGAVKGLQLPTAAALDTQNNEAQVKWLELKFESALSKQLATYSRQHNSSIFTVLYSTIAAALQEQGQLKELVIGTSASGRTDPQFFDTVGYFTTMVAHRVQFNPSDTFAALLHRISSMINDSMAYADIPINHIQNALGMSADEGLIFDVFIHIHANNALNGALKSAQGTDIPYRQILPERNESMFGLHFEILENVINEQHQLSMIITYQAHRFATDVVESIAAKINARLAQL